MTESKTVWYICKYVAPPQGAGVGGRGYELMRELAEFGHRSVIVTSDANHLVAVPKLTGRVLREQRDGMDVYWLRTFKTPAPRSWRRIAGWLHFEWRLLRFDEGRLTRPDAIIVSSLSLLTILNGLRLKRKYRVPLVFEVRDIWPLTLVAEGGYGAHHPLVRALGLVEKLGYRHADRIVGTMPALGRHVQSVLGRERRVDCIPQGYSRRTFACHAPDPPRRTGGELVVGYAGTIGAGNALEVMFEAARLLRHESAIRFRVLGDGPLLPYFKAKYGDLESVTFVPRVPKAEVAAELEKCDVLYVSTYPSVRWEFGQSLNKLIDYMMAARPVLASYSGYPSMIDEAGCGTVVPAGDPAAVADALRTYAAMPAAALATMGSRGREWVLENRSYGRLAEAYHDIMFPPTSA